MIAKVFWTLLTIAFAVLAYFVVHESFSDFFSFKTTSSSEKKQNMTLIFPAISLCWDSAKKSGIIIDQNSTFNKIRLSILSINYENFTFAQYVCTRINGDINFKGNLLVSKEEGQFNGMNLQLKSSAEKLFIYIGNNSYWPLVQEIENTVLRSKHDVSIAIRRVDSELLPRPYGDCKNLNGPDDFNSTAYKMVFNSANNNITYRQVNCLDKCAFTRTLEICGCKQSPRFCLDCFYNASYSFNKMEVCSPDCPLECKSMTFDRSLQAFYLPNASSDYFSINIYYESMFYYDEVQSPKVTFVGLISSLGGNFGLFLGLSLMSFFEFFQFLLELVILILRLMLGRL